MKTENSQKDLIKSEESSQDQKDYINKSKFWDKTDQIAVMTAGGIALGGAIAQLPGAVIGGIVAAGYGYYVNFVKPKSA